MISNLVEQLRRDEGEVLHAYQDSLGYWTIGVGRLIDGRKGGSISRDESANMLANDIAAKLDEMDKRMPWYRGLDAARQGVLVNMAFQLGVDGLLTFKTTLGLIQARKFEEASSAMKASKWYSQTPVRAERLIAQLKDGTWH